jgi:hypothetical protein
MAAIRTNQNEIADYLIDQLAVNVQYAADLLEFRLRTQSPIRHRRLSCRELAYDNGMMELVDLIDITSDDVTPTIKRYLKTRLQIRLNNIHQAYLKRLEKHVLFQKNKEKETKEPPTENITDENILSPMLPTITPRVYKSHIEETIESLDTSKDKSIDETGKKTFRFSNYKLRFRLLETSDPDKKTNEQFQFKSTTPSRPKTSLYASSLTPLITTNNSRHSITQFSSRLSTRDTRASICRSARPQIISIENKQPVTLNTDRSFSKRFIQNNYIPQPQHFMPVTLKSTAIGLSFETRIIRD